MSKDKHQSKRLYSVRGAVTKRKLKRLAAAGQSIKLKLKKQQQGI